MLASFAVIVRLSAAAGERVECTPRLEVGRAPTVIVADAGELLDDQERQTASPRSVGADFDVFVDAGDGRGGSEAGQVPRPARRRGSRSS